MEGDDDAGTYDGDDDDDADNDADNDGADNDSNRTPVIVLVRTFIMSFFASLIPETPAL